jgi:hypothetical protein
MQRAAHLDTDRFFDFIESGFVPPWLPESHEQNATVMRIAGDAAAAYAADGYFTIVEGIVIPRWFLTPLRERIEREGRRVAYAVLRAPLELCVARRSHVDGAVVEGIWRQFGDLGPLERNVIDVADTGPEGLAAELEEGLETRFLLSP